jgi:hypothetical protein
MIVSEEDKVRKKDRKKERKDRKRGSRRLKSIWLEARKIKVAGLISRQKKYTLGLRLRSWNSVH